MLGCAVLVGLGLWQVQRLQWKQGILARIEAQITAAPVALPAAPDPGADRYLPVTVTGRFLAGEARVLAGLKGAGPGFRVIAPFETEEGRRILIDRGFLREADKGGPRSRPAGITVTGNLHWPQETDRFTPAPDPAADLWFARDVPEMAGALGTEPVLLVAATPTDPAIAPLPVDTSAIPNDHAGYAATWFGLALVWAGMTLALVRRITRADRQKRAT